MQNLSSYLASAISALGFIGLWKMFDDRNEPGWKAIIPFLSEYTLGKVCDEEELGRKSARIQAVFILLMIPVLMCLFLGAADSNSLLGVIGFVGIAVEAVLGVLAVIAGFKLRYRFCVANDAQTWMTIVWIAVPAFAQLYFAFVHKKYDIPGITEKEKDYISEVAEKEKDSE